MKLSEAIAAASQGRDLSVEETKDIFDIIFTGDASEDDIVALLTTLRNKGEAVSELQGAVLSMRSKMNSLIAPEGTIDIVGTGGDGHGTLNISTAAAIITAACGVPVAKHGNRAATSLSGSSDVLAALGVNLEPTWDNLQRALQEIGLTFLFAPRHHPSMKFVIGARKKLATRTIFNLLGPMTNPANVKLHVIGVFDQAWSRPMAETLQALGSTHAWLTHGHSGLDEISTTGPTHICEMSLEGIREFEVHPEDVPLPTATLDAIKGGDAAHNAAAIHALLDGEKSPYRDIVLMNVGAALIVAGKADTLSKAVKLAAKAIDSGKAKDKLAQLVAISNGRA